MPSIDIQANVNVNVNATRGGVGGSPPTGSGTPANPPQAAPASANPNAATSAAGQQAVAADIAAREAAARRALTQRLGKIFTDAQIAQIARDFGEMSRFSGRLKRYGGDMEHWIEGFRGTFPSQRQANQHYREVMQQLGIVETTRPGVSGMLRQAGMGVLRAAGVGGGVAGNILHHSFQQAGDTEGGAASAGGLGMLGKGAGIAALAYLGIKGVQKVGQKFGDAKDEAVQYHDLRQSVGSSAVGFEELRESVRRFSVGLGITSSESAKLARTYAQSSQVSGRAAQNSIGMAVGQGTAMSRGFGLSPEAGVEFLGTLRHFRATDGSEQSNRRLAYLIGDAVGKTDAFAKADDVLSAIAHFTETSTRQSLSPANVAGFSDLMGALGGLKLPGLDAKGSAGLLQQIAGSWATGGGEAGAAFRLGWAQEFGATALDMPAISDAGPFASPDSTFGVNSAQYALARSDKTRARYLAMAQAGGNKTFLDRELERMRGTIGDEFLAPSISGKYGISNVQANALLAANAQQGGVTGLMDRVNAALKQAGKDPAKANVSQISTLAMIDNAKSAELAAMREQARKLTGKNALTDQEKQALDAAQGDDALKTILTQIHAIRETEDDGKTARQAQIDLDNKFKDYASKILPATNAIQEGVFGLLDKVGGLTPEMKQYQANRAYQERLDKEGSGEGAKERKQAITDEAIKFAKQGPMSQAEYDQRRQAIGANESGDPALATHEARQKAALALRNERDQRNALQPDAVKQAIAKEATESAPKPSEREAVSVVQSSVPDADKTSKALAVTASRKPAAAGTLSESEKAYLAETDRLLGAPKGTSEAQIMVESGGNSNAVSPRKAWGLGQIMPREKGVMETRMGRKIVSRADQLEAHRLMMLENLRKFGTVEKAQKAYNGGWKESAWGNKETSEYVGKISDYRDKLIPGEARPASRGDRVARITGAAEINVNYPDGRSDKVALPLTGQFKQTVAGLSRG